MSSWSMLMVNIQLVANKLVWLIYTHTKKFYCSRRNYGPERITPDFYCVFRRKKYLIKNLS